MPRKILILGFLFLLTSCSSIRMKYEATVVDDLFQTAQFEYYKSYDVGSLDNWCLATGVFLGGACWRYLTLSDDIKEKMAKDANKKLTDIFGQNNFKFKNIKVSSFGWNELPEDYLFPSGQPLVNNSPYIYLQKPKNKAALEAARNDGIGEN